MVFVIKVYGKCEEFPDGGYVSQYLGGLKEGDKVTMEGPIGRLNYLGKGDFLVSKKPRKGTKIGLIAGGSGITPMYSLANCIKLADEKDMDVKLIFTNKTEDDIL